LTMLGQAMELIESFDDANYAFGQAIRQDKEYADAYAAWGLLLLAKYNIPDAKRSFEDALRSNPAHPDALVGMATVEMLTSNQSDKVRVYLGRAAEVAPGLAGVSMVRAHLAMGDEDCLRAREAADEVLSRQPKHLEALSIHVTCDYLADDLKAYAESRDAVLALNPKYADLLAMTAEYAIRSHRYVEAMDVYRHALRIDPEHGRSLLGLGVGLSRIGKEDEAVTYLERANEVDPYNVRAYNMAELYENVLNRYGFTEFDGFKLRSSPEQAEMIDLIVAPVVSEAMGVFSAKYAFTPHEYLAVEVYPDPATFSVRSVGLPNISPHGICFGRVVTVRSPSDGNFNWKQVLWHELAHVYHIQLSNSRVPRWFTEGLAEYETNVYDPSWVRHHDQEIAVKLFKGEVPSVLELNRGFTHAKSYDEVLRSYHLSSLAIHYIAQKWTFERIPDMLRAWGESKGTPEVFEGVLGVTTSEFDDGFARWLELRHMTFQQQLMVDLEEVRSPKELERARRLNERDPKLWAETALSHMVRGEPDEMEDALHVALQKAPDDAWVNHVAAMIRAKQGRPKDTLVHGGKVLAALEDSYELRVLLGRASLVTDDLEGARVHFEAASQLYPDGIEAWSLLGRLGRNTKDEELYQRSLARIYELNQHDAGVARLRAKRLQDDGVWELLGEVAERWYDINPFDPSVHRARAKSFLELGDG
ncbi:MAG: tetratricopeptide repeat protein, partial [Myxococcota bacterium]